MLKLLQTGNFTVVDTNLFKLNGNIVTASAEEINLIDTSEPGVVKSSKAVIYGSNGSIRVSNNGLDLGDLSNNHYLKIKTTDELQDNRTLTINTNDSNRTLTIEKDLVFKSNEITIGDQTIKTTGVTNVTLPTSGTLATLSNSEELSNKIINNSTIGLTTPLAGNFTNLNITNNFKIKGTEVLSSANELNLLDGSEIGVPKGSKAVIYDSAGSVISGSQGIKLHDIDGNKTLTLKSNEQLSDNKTLTININNDNKTFKLTGDLTIDGNYSTKLNTTGVTDIILPTTGTIATLSGSESLSNKAISSSTIDNTPIGMSNPATGKFTNMYASTIYYGGQQINATANQINFLHNAGPNTIQNSKSVIYSSSGNITANEAHVSKII